jgi:uncharacterized protein (TIGR03067 family)
MRRIACLLPVLLLIAAEPPKDDAKKELELLQGEWKMVSGEREGQKLPDNIIETGKRILKGDETTVEINGMVLMKAKITLDPSKKPKAIDYKITEGQNADKKVLGIYELEGDTVKFCFSSPDAERPTDFTAKEGSKRILSVWKKAKK